MRDPWLGLVAQNNTHLAELPLMQSITRRDGTVRVLLAQEEGSLNLVSSESLMELVAVDAAGRPTSIAFSDLERAAPFPTNFFTLRYRPYGKYKWK